MSDIEIPHFEIEYFDNEQILRDILDKLRSEDLYHSDLLFRSIEHRYLDNLLKHGTDRVGFSKELDAETRSEYPNLKYEDAIFASTEDEFEWATKSGDNYLTLLCNYFSMDHITVYDGSQFDSLPVCEYKFKHPDRKKDSLVAIFDIKDKD